MTGFCKYFFNKSLPYVIAVLSSVLLSNSVFCQTRTEGFYKDLFMDGGVNLTSRTSLPAADSLGLSMEYIATSYITVQSSVMISNDYDANGALLYPDGEPRFRVIYTNGGSATSHGESLGESGRQIIRTYFNNGGSYTGSCAGAFISSLGTSTELSSGSSRVGYYHLWPGYACSTGQSDIRTGHFIIEDSPLLQYYDFGGDNYVRDVYHNGGCYAYEPNMPTGTEILARYDYPSSAQMHLNASVWAYKDGGNSEEGRLVVTGSHPEGISSGERLDLMSAILQYALEGVGENHIKSELSNRRTRIMDKSTEDNDPAYTKIGDRQYHHFIVNLPEETTSLTLSVSGDDRYDLFLYVNPGDFAFNSNALYKDITEGANKEMVLYNLPEGTYYVSVECNTTVTAMESSEYFEYISNLEVLNGVAYSIRAEWSGPNSINELDETDLKIYPNPFTEHITLYVDNNFMVEEVAILDIFGKLMSVQKVDKPSGYITIREGLDLPPGIYYLRIRSANKVYVKKIVKVAD